MGDISVPADFVIAMYWRQGYAPYLGYDDDSPIDDRSFFYNETWYPWPYEEDLMIRAVMNMLDSLGVDPDNIFYDDFGG